MPTLLTNNTSVMPNVTAIGSAANDTAEGNFTGPISIFPVYTPVFIGVLPVFALGILFNGVILLTFIANRNKLIAGRIDRLFVLMTFIFFLWSTYCITDYILEDRLPDFSLTLYQLEGVLSSIFVLLIYGTNLMLAAERYFVVCESPDERNEKYFTVLIVFIGVFSWIITWISATSLPDADFKEPLQLKIVFRCLYAYCIVCTLASVTLYYTAYSHSSRQLRESLAVIMVLVQDAELKGIKDTKTDPPQIVRMQLDRKILVQCMVMASGLVICYIPAILLNVVPTVFPRMTKDGYIVWAELAEMMLSLDVLVTPLLILYYKRDIMSCWRFFQPKRVRS
ncbi:hypothetical protein BC830DRAFT_1175255 [Chytriomyces sp. MP71]|nr:hypothetical protein BC830DRAFT_1175255 [Chytriomyces sp. MP71]